MASLWEKSGKYLDLIYAFPASVLAGVATGMFLDHRWSTRPWLTLTGFALGLVAGFHLLFRTLRSLDRKGGK